MLYVEIMTSSQLNCPVRSWNWDNCAMEPSRNFICEMSCRPCAIKLLSCQGKMPPSMKMYRFNKRTTGTRRSNHSDQRANR